MSREYHLRLKEIFARTAEVEPEHLEVFLQEACEGDSELLEELLELTALERRTADDFLEPPLFAELGDAPPPEVESNPSPENPPGEGWERYTQLELIAEGGMGEVYRAWDPRLKRHTALKFVRAPKRKQVERFLLEAEAQARVEHDNVLEVYETGEVDSRLYIAMRYVDGPTLLETRDEVSVVEKVRIMRQVSEAIHAAHRQGLVHRDVKPSNVLMERTEDRGYKPYVMDFGIVASMEGPGLTTTGDLLGTPWYMAPERVSWGPSPVDRRSDVYSLGVTLFEYLCGQRPFSATSPLEMLSQIKDREPTSLRQIEPALPVDLETIVMKCLERDPNRRYQSARALADDLQRFLDGEAINARRATITYRLIKRARRHRAVVTVATVALLFLVAMGIANLRGSQQARVREDLARDFASRIQQIDHVMRMAKVAPLHDLGSDKEAVRRMMASIRDRLEATGLLGEGSGHFALGRGYLALEEYRRAREHLERAWNRGYRGPEVAYALGRVLGELYQQQLREVETIQDAELREQRKRQLHVQLLQPALVYLRRSGGVGGESPEYVEALIAYLEGRFEEALAAAKLGYERLPWLYEARKLEGDILASMGLETWRHGETEAAFELSTRAQAAYAEASTVARSDSSTLIHICELGLTMMEIELAHDSDQLRRPFEIAKTACENALRTDVELVQAHRLLTDLHCHQAGSAIVEGDDPRTSLAAAAHHAERAMELRPEEVDSHLAVGNAWLADVRYQNAVAGDATPPVDEAIDAFRRAIEADPRSWRAHSLLGQALIARADIEVSGGEDPRRSLVLAIAALASATDIAHEDIHAHDAHGEAQLRMARFLFARGEDPLLSLDRALEAYRTTVEINPDYMPGHLGLAHSYHLEAAWLEQNTEDSNSSRESATAAAERVLALVPGNADALALMEMAGHDSSIP